MTEPVALNGPQRIIRRMIAERRDGAPDVMVAKYAITEALHQIAGHDGDACNCTPCHRAMALAVEIVAAYPQPARKHPADGGRPLLYDPHGTMGERP